MIGNPGRNDVGGGSTRMKVLVCLAFARLGNGSVVRVQDPVWRQVQLSDLLS